ncbi:MAG: hypothetical protein K5785_03445 [Nitrosarchaeum sp.]|nr:hypothetical protein [Nitrosarchaeum sp.]
MAKGVIATGILVFKAGFIAGILFGISTTFEVPTNQYAIANFVLDEFCELELLDNEQTQYNCDVMRNWLIAISIIAFLVSIFAPIRIFGHWIVGLLIYGISWIVGYLLLLQFVPQ